MGAGTLAALLYAISSRASRMRRGIREVVMVRPPHAGHPELPPAVPPVGMELPGLGTVLDEEDADVSDDKTVITRSFPLGDGASVTLKNTNGEITIEGWDEPRAEVKITKRGGSDEERQMAQIRSSKTAGGLSLVTMPASPAVKVQYEIKVPRGLKQLEIASLNSHVRLSNFKGGASINIQRGEIELSDVGGAVSTRIIQGDTKVTFDELEEVGTKTNELTSINGNIEVRFESEMDADLQAETINGQIETDDDFNLKVEKRPAGKRLVGQMGKGGKPIRVKVINGNVKFSK